MEVERELKLLLPPGTVDTSMAESVISITQLHFLQGETSLRLRRTSISGSGLPVRYDLTLKFRTGEASEQFSVPLDPNLGAEIFAIGLRIYVPIVRKTRYLFQAIEELKWEVDIFSGEHDFLVIAELEYSGKIPPVWVHERPRWYLGTEWDYPQMDITGDWEYLDQILNLEHKAFDQFKKKTLLKIGRIQNAHADPS